MAQISISHYTPPAINSRLPGGFQPYSLRFPKYNMGRTGGPRILYVVNCVPYDEHNKQELGSGCLGYTLEELTSYSDQRTGGKLSEFCVRNFYLAPFGKDSVGSIEYQTLVSCSWESLRKFIIKYDPTSVVFFGLDIADCVWPNEDNVKYLGRIRPFSIGEKTFKGVVSLDLYHMVNTPDNIKGALGRPAMKDEVKHIIKSSCLLGFVQQHIQTAIEGRNRYNLNKIKYETKIISDIQQFRAFFKELEKSKTPCFDVETVSLSKKNNRILTIQITLDGKVGYLLPIQHRDTPFIGKELIEIKRRFRKYIETGTSNWLVFHNAKFDLTQMIAQFGVRYINHDIYDTMLGEYCLDENLIGLRGFTYHGQKLHPYSLETLGFRYGSTIYDEGVISKENRSNMEKYSLEELAEYGVKDVILPFHIMQCQIKEALQVRDNKKFIKTVTRLLGSITKVMIKMEYHGVPVDRNYLLSLKAKDSYFNKKIRAIEQKFSESEAVLKANDIMIRKTGNVPGSLFKKAKQLVFDIRKKEHKYTLFFEVLGLEPLAIGKDGYPSTGTVFKKHYKDVPEVKLLSELAGAQKLRDTYVVKFADRMLKNEDSRIDSCVRGYYSLVDVVTGRASAAGSLHQIPQHSEDAKQIKRMFVVPRGYIFIKPDFSAHEVRGWANIANDKTLIGNFAVGLEYRRKRRLAITKEELEEIEKILDSKGDLHRLNYQHFFGVPAEKVNDDQRQNVKKVVFGVIYGKMAKGLAEELKISEEDAQELINKLFSTLKQGADWLKMIIKSSRDTMHIEYTLGQVRHLWGHFNSSEAIKRAMDRRGPNSNIQGTSSHLAFLSGYLADEMFWHLCTKNDIPVDCHQCNGVHDSMESIGKLVQAPFLAYVIEHAMTTQLAKFCEEEFDFSFHIDTEADFAFGGAMSAMKKWKFRDDEFLKIMDQSIDWMNAEMHYGLDKDKYMKGITHNLGIVSKFRKKELKHALANKGKVAKLMLINESNIKDLDLIWDL